MEEHSTLFIAMHAVIHLRSIFREAHTRDMVTPPYKRYHGNAISYPNAAAEQEEEGGSLLNSSQFYCEFPPDLLLSRAKPSLIFRPSLQ